MQGADKDDGREQLVERLRDLKKPLPSGWNFSRDEANERGRGDEPPSETATRLRERHGIELNKQAQQPLPRKIFDDFWED